MLLTKRGVIWPGYVCNKRCIFCYNKGIKNEWKGIEYIKEEIIKNKGYGNKYIDFMGGEATLHPNIFQIVTFCREIGINPTIITNGIKLSDIDFCEKLKFSGIGDILISIHGIRVADLIFNSGKGNFELQRRAIENMNYMGIPFRINTTLIRYNLSELVEIAKFAKRNGANRINFITFNPHLQWSKSYNILFQASYSEMAKALQGALEFCEKANMLASIRYFPFCKIKGYERYVYNCTQLPYDEHEWNYNSWHDLHENNPSPEWYFDEGKKQAKRNGCLKLKRCSNCALREICDGFNHKYTIFNDIVEPYDGKVILDPTYFIENE